MSAGLRRRRVAVDWDATLAVEGWPEIGIWLPGATEALKYLASVYDEVVIYTLRVSPVDVDEVTPRDPSDQIRLIYEKLDQEGLPPNVTVWTRPYKPPCVAIIDDKVLRFEGDWVATLERLKEIDPTNHKEEPVPGDLNEYLEQQRIKKQWCDDPVVPSGRDAPTMRQFETGATRNNDADEFDYEGFLSPLALWAYASYMHKHRFQADGNVRASDNWLRGIPRESYRKSLIRHVMDLWLNERSFTHLSRGDSVDALCAIIFNAQGLLHETLKAEL